MSSRFCGTGQVSDQTRGLIKEPLIDPSVRQWVQEEAGWQEPRPDATGVRSEQNEGRGRPLPMGSPDLSDLPPVPTFITLPRFQFPLNPGFGVKGEAVARLDLAFTWQGPGARLSGTEQIPVPREKRSMLHLRASVSQ